MKIEHPGKLLLCKLEECGLSASELARKIGVPKNRITTIIKGTRSITGDTALRLAHFFQTPPEYWMELQLHFDLNEAKVKSKQLIQFLPQFHQSNSNSISKDNLND
ncbi:MULTISPECIES: HigA family addiction module antitoxin [Enterobacterales]|jgi:antitoxin HigA-1|uniref:HigA family addiction module antitoxin n=1 Tax=Photorhabdus bodei TaxID=2029681 RepID=A0AAW6BNH2_9GAMM|nr:MULTISPECIES: HigA family addiction module antitoxin [Enterobacterales]EGL2811660.1 HigA family addiction module antidote protein [Salmonella enterica]EIL3027390.1 HigA family addiction module antidote protein [Salmonella enterica subsp. enterica serovar Schwarzengrund]PQQ38827.1 addiction module antidote protein, HigA family [Photorhabdus luminescens]MCC8464745.1 HigA family addiction module antidote protein [Photorhabdus bodei]MDB6374351.1 HigA family addiction module antitoxin [Photorhab